MPGWRTMVINGEAMTVDDAIERFSLSVLKAVKQSLTDLPEVLV